MANIRLENISKIYGVAKKKGQLPEGKKAVNNINLNIPEGSFTILVGPSGCGKTTLLRMIAGLETITLGNIYINDIDVTNYEPGDRGLAMVFQNYALYPHMTIYENIEFGLKNARIPKHEIKSRIDYVLNLVNLSEYANRRPANLSGGQRQRVALARAIAKKPQVFLMDEPLSNLDAKLRSTMRSELIQIHRKLKSTFIYVTHDQIEAMTMGDYIVCMSEGVIKQTGTPTKIHDDPDNVFVAQFIGDPGMNIITLSSGNKVGIRPRMANIVTNTTDNSLLYFDGIIFTHENHGGEQLYSVKIKDSTIFVKDIDKHIKELNSKVIVAMHKEDLYFFDSNENRIRDKQEIEKIYDELRNEYIEN